MDITYQRFDLDLEAMTEIISNGSAGSHDSKESLPARKLIDELKKKGYGCLVANEIINGVPKSIIVGGVLRMDIKGDFYELAEKLGLPFRSGEEYNQYSFPQDEPIRIFFRNH